MTDNQSAILAQKGMLSDPGTHFQGKYEVELKFRVNDLEEIRTKLIDAGAIEFSIGNNETDYFFDLKDKSLERNNQFMTLRQMLPSERVLWISKGPGTDECTAMDLPEFDKAKAMLISLGYVETLQIFKRRDIYFIDQFHATLDRIEKLGTFVELAVMSERKSELHELEKRIHVMANKLGLSAFPQETNSYRQLMLD